MKKRFLLIMLTAMMTLGSTMTVCAAPKTMPDGGTFDEEYYAKKYPDVVAALGTDENALYMHYNTFGKQEGRMPYGDLDESFFVPEDKYYLRAGWVQVGYDYTDGEYMDPALGFVRGDYTSTKLYQDLKADFLCLGDQVETSDPEQFRLMSRSFADLFPELELQISVSGRLTHTNDVRDV